MTLALPVVVIKDLCFRVVLQGNLLVSLDERLEVLHRSVLLLIQLSRGDKETAADFLHEASA